MKKTCAIKVLAVVLAMVMVLGTSLSAMAATVTSTTTVKDGVTKVTSNVSGLSGNEMATYLITDAASLYQVDSTNIKYIDQKDAASGAVKFEYTGDALTADDKIYVGAESLSTPVQSEDPTEVSGAAVYENGVLKGLNGNLTNTEGTAKDIALAGNVANVTSVYKNGIEVPFAKKANCIAVFCALEDGDALNIYYTSTVVSSASIIERGEFVSSKGNGNNTGTVTAFNIREALGKGVEQGESGPNEYWFTGKYTGDQTFTYDKAAATAYYNKLDDAKKTSFRNNYPELYALIEAGSDATEWTKSFDNETVAGLAINTGTFEPTLQVAESGVYKLMARTKSYELSRKPTFAIYDGDTLVASSTITPALKDRWNFAAADGTVTLEGGKTYTLKISANALVRFDFVAFVPAGEPADAAIAGQEAFMSEIEKSEVAADAEVRIGDVTLTDTALTVLARVFGVYNSCGIDVNGSKYEALGVAGNGAFAVELQDDAGMIDAFQSAAVKAFATNEWDEYIYAGPVTPTVK